MLYICIPLKSCLWMCCKTQCWKSMILCYFMITTKYTQNISQPTQKELFYNKWLYENMKQLIMLILETWTSVCGTIQMHSMSCNWFMLKCIDLDLHSREHPLRKHHQQWRTHFLAWCKMLSICCLSKFLSGDGFLGKPLLDTGE